ncbi:MAG: hypothetical protein GY703_14560 [Gammaproteobacteria bacterium]|nr:hypothetical protein [Gammaproteobacteria bacterium]
MKTVLMFRSAFFLLSMLIVGGAGAGGADSPEHWPCTQVYVPSIPAVVVWAGPQVKETARYWQSFPEVSRLVSRLVAPGMSLSEAENEIARFAGGQLPVQKDRMLSLLFAGILERLNADRGRLMSGILSYSRGQDERAQQLGEVLDQIARLEGETSEAAQLQSAKLKESLSIGQRMFDDRESSIQYLCTRPIVVEQRLGSLARAIALHLD